MQNFNVIKNSNVSKILMLLEKLSMSIKNPMLKKLMSQKFQAVCKILTSSKIPNKSAKISVSSKNPNVIKNFKIIKKSNVSKFLVSSKIQIEKCFNIIKNPTTQKILNVIKN